MARSSRRFLASDEEKDWRDIEANLAKTRIAPDLLAGMEPTASKRATKAAVAKQPTFDVIIEFNRSFPGGIASARATLLSAYAKTPQGRAPSRPMRRSPFCGRGMMPTSLRRSARMTGWRSGNRFGPTVMSSPSCP